MAAVISSNDMDGYSPIFEGGWLKKEGQGIDVRMNTKDLVLCSVSENNRADYVGLYTDPETMKMFTDNEERLSKKTLEEWKQEQTAAVAKRIQVLVQRWKEGNPFSAFAIYHQPTHQFIGHIVAGFGDHPGESEIAFIIHKNYQQKGYGSQAVEAVMQKWLPYLQAQKYEISEEVDGKSVSKVISHVVATVRQDNEPSIRILVKNGFTKTGEKEAWGCKRSIYEKDLC